MIVRVRVRDRDSERDGQSMTGRERAAWVRVKASHRREEDTSMGRGGKRRAWGRGASKELKIKLRVNISRKKKKRQKRCVLWLSEPGQNRFNRSGSRFWRLNRRFPVFSLFFHFSGFFREPDRIRHRSPVEPAGPVRFLKPWLKWDYNGDSKCAFRLFFCCFYCCLSWDMCLLI